MTDRDKMARGIDRMQEAQAEAEVWRTSVIFCTEVVLRTREVELTPPHTEADQAQALKDAAVEHITSQIWMPAPNNVMVASMVADEVWSIGTFEILETWEQPEHEVSEVEPVPTEPILDPWGAGDPVWCHSDWIDEVAAGDTRLGYVDWVHAQRESSREQEREACAIPEADPLDRLHSLARGLAAGPMTPVTQEDEA
jgi:hypothetical protein